MLYLRNEAGKADYLWRQSVEPQFVFTNRLERSYRSTVDGRVRKSNHTMELT